MNFYTVQEISHIVSLIENFSRGYTDMQAIKISEPCEANELQPVEVPTPQLVPGFTLVEVKAFGVNESKSPAEKGIFK